MTVGEVIEALQKADPNLEVYIGENMEGVEVARFISEIRNLHDTGCVPYVVITTAV